VRILFVAHTYLRWAGDRAGAQVHRFALEAKARGHEVLVVAPHAAGAKEGAEVLDGIQVIRFRYASDAGERIGYQGAVGKSVGSLGALLTLPKYLREFKAAVRRSVADFKPDVVSVHWWAPGGLATEGLSVPVAITCHGSDVRLLTTNWLIRMIGRRVLPAARGVSAVSGVMASDLRQYGGVREVAITRMPVADELFVPASRDPKVPVILYAGNLIRAKGVDLILHAAAELRRRGAIFRLRLVGDGPDRAEFERLGEELGLQQVVEWAGTREHHQMPAEFAAASIFVLASRGPRGEGMPLTVVEALMSECAVVATPAGGVPEIITEGETGLLARDNDVGSLAAQLGRLVGDRTLREALATAGRARALGLHGKGPAMNAFFAFLTRTAGRESS
jgi:glycosyltransferase involved in cell wall biosynthesis